MASAPMDHRPPISDKALETAPASKAGTLGVTFGSVCAVVPPNPGKALPVISLTAASAQSLVASVALRPSAVTGVDA